MRVGIVNDSAMALEALRRTVASRHEVAWIARDGVEAVEHCAADKPDIILMDLMMPVLGGVAATRRIMATTPCPILVVTASVNGHAAAVFESLGAGALDAIATPRIDAPEGANALLVKMEMLGRLMAPAAAQAGVAPFRGGARTTGGLVAVGSSAGGPAALAIFLGKLPTDLRAAVVVVQHVDAQFVPGLASWLNDQSPLPVRLAVADDRPVPGTVVIAGGDQHLVLRRDGSLNYQAEPVACSYRPSVDVFFESVAAQWKGRVAGVLLSGMGRDGARGLKLLRDGGALTLAQDQASCAVYGMPKAAMELGAAQAALPPAAIATRVGEYF